MVAIDPLRRPSGAVSDPEPIERIRDSTYAGRVRREEALKVLRDHHDELVHEHHVRSISIFGSVARDEASPDSDVDILVEFDRRVGLLAFAGLKLALEEWLQARVDLATPAALHPRLKADILREAIRAA